MKCSPTTADKEKGSPPRPFSASPASEPAPRHTQTA